MGWRTSRPTETATSRIASSPPKPRLSERRRHAWTVGSSRATNQNRAMGSAMQAHHTASQASVIASSHDLGAAVAMAATRKTLAAANDASATACQREGRGMRVSR